MNATERIEELRTYAPENLTERDLDFLLKAYDEMRNIAINKYHPKCTEEELGTLCRRDQCIDGELNERMK